MKLMENVYLVAAGDNGMSLTSPLDCNVYLIDTGKGALLIDAGANHQPELMDAVIASHGFEMSDIKIILLTHYHADHSCGANRLHKLTGASVYAPEQEAEAIAKGDTQALGLARAMAAGYVYPDGYKYEACPAVQPIADGETISLGDVEITAQAVPGHSLQSMVYSARIGRKACLFTGDALFPRGEILLQNLPDVCIYPYAQALKELALLEVDALFPGHREPSLCRGKRHLDAANNIFDGLLIPPQLF